MKLKLSVLAMALLLGVTGAFAQDNKGIGARFDAREPQSCASRKEPAKGAPTAAQAKLYYLCQAEYMQKAGSPENDQLSLRTNVIVEVGKGRPFNILTDSGCTPCNLIDPTQTVYPIRGSSTFWTCYPTAKAGFGAIGVTPGKNCSKGEDSGATGMCFKTTFGDWYCPMGGTLTFEAGLNILFPGPKGN